MSIFQMTIDFLTDPANWSGPRGIPQTVLTHLGYTLLALAIAAVVAFPVGLLIGHTGKGAFIAINAGNAGRAVPTIGLIALVVLATSPTLIPVSICLALLAIPPLLTSTYTGIRAVDPDVVDAARGIGMTESTLMWKVELPNALPVIISGVRSAALQVVSTATVAAFVGMGGLGRYILDGPPQRDYGKMATGAVLVAALAIAVDLLLAGLGKLITPRGLQGAGRRRLAARSTDDRGSAGAGTADPDEPDAGDKEPTPAPPDDAMSAALLEKESR